MAYKVHCWCADNDEARHAAYNTILVCGAKFDVPNFKSKL
jgi:hypothetical protein